MAAFQKFNNMVADLANKVHNLGADTLKVLLTNTAPVATNTVIANITEIAAGNGYSTGGAAVAIASSTQSSGLYKLLPAAATVVWTATGTVGPFRYVVLYNSTAAAGNLLGWYDNGSNVTMNSGDTFTVTLDTVNGLIQLQ